MTSVAAKLYAPVAKIDEGWVPKVYKNYKGLPTLGYGHLVTESSQKTLTELGVPKSRARRILQGKGSLTPTEGERLLLKNIGRKEKEVAFILGKQRYDKLPMDKKVAMLGLRFRGDFAKYNNPIKGTLSKEYKHAVAGRYNLAAKAMQHRVKNAPVGVRKRVERHTRPLLSKKHRDRPTAVTKGILTTAAIATVLGAATLAMKRSKRKKLNRAPVPLYSHPIALTPNKKRPERKPKTGRRVSVCPGGKERSPKTGRCISVCAAGKERNPKTGRCVKTY